MLCKSKKKKKNYAESKAECEQLYSKIEILEQVKDSFQHDISEQHKLSSALEKDLAVKSKQVPYL